MSVVNCTDDEVKVEFSKPDPEAGKAALGALEMCIRDRAKCLRMQGKCLYYIKRYDEAWMLMNQALDIAIQLSLIHI